MTEFTLHCFHESGNAYKAALMLQLCRAGWTPKRVAFFTGETRGPEFRGLNVMGEVPVLTHHRPDGDFTVTQSGAILTYLARHFGKFGPETEAEEFEVMRWLLFDSQKVSGYAGPLRFLRFFMKKGETEDVQFLHGRVTSALKIVNAALENREWIAADRPTIADFALCGYLFWPDEIGTTFDERPNVAAWLNRIRALPGFELPEALMPSGQETKTATA
ncbi:glutathione S-transferase family protein [Oricola cellulosilytica]|uniref:Glutathione S-transferase family protein n=1 Tax=Oricola cellulosilytica TaxID=1429082 RepID=A0A4R0PIL9_9HYPH|nr:glutathione S-transferase family protein [Oricola cellulosilytica]TCD16534.1 glutathione S-transferase family protein [Oricola cellulosilytica]